MRKACFKLFAITGPEFVQNFVENTYTTLRITPSSVFLASVLNAYFQAPSTAEQKPPLVLYVL
ncbi:MAG: hypothetical protein KGN79_16490 [Acidobacteriota bacterium]|nr:hypothetical protein [Acidobacteriota bacterium]